MNALTRLCMLVALMLLLGFGTGWAQFDTLGGPYTPDANTMLLLHFDGDYSNLGQSANAIGNGKVSFFPIPPRTGLGQCLQIDNGARGDSSYVTVADTSTLDLQGDWTIEGWVNIFTFGGAGDYRWVPRLCIKPGDVYFWQPNFWVEMWGSSYQFQTGFHDTTQSFWPAVNSPPNSFQPGQWFHLTFIRDAARHTLVQMIHDANLNMLFYGSNVYDSTLAPLTNSQKVHIGWAGAEGIPNKSVDSWLDGFVDEIRISNIVRNFKVPPVITDVTQLANQQSSVPNYPINAKIVPFNPASTISTARVRYDNGTGWQEVTMTGTAGNYTGVIPGHPVGTVIKYYVYALDNNDLRATWPAFAETPDSSFVVFGVYTPNTNIMNLAGEQTVGLPYDSSAYHNVATAPNYAPIYSTDAKAGLHSIHFYKDSTHVEFNTPFLAAEDFTVDFWFNADTLIHAARLINKMAGNADGTAADDWYHNNYEVVWRQVSGIFRLAGRYWLDAGDAQWEVRLDNALPIESHKWYRAIFERDASGGYVALRDENDVLLQDSTFAGAKPRMGAGALRVAKASNDGQAWSYIPHFIGKMDNIKIYNYRVGLVGVGEGNSNQIPHVFELSQNYPNPFNPSTEIQFSVPKAGYVTLVVYDVLGREVRTLGSEYTHAGEHRVRWNGVDNLGRPVASGVYFYRLQAGELTKVRSMMLLK